MRRNVAILIFDKVEVLDFAGPFEVFGVTGELNAGACNVFTVAESPGTIQANHGLKLAATHTLESCPAPHVLVIPGGYGTRALLQRPGLLEWVKVKARSAELVMSVCTGALVLARCGLLDGLCVTTHHDCLDLLSDLAPGATVDPARRYHDNGKILTAAGISAGLDCSLHVVRRLFGADVAAATARYMEYRENPAD